MQKTYLVKQRFFMNGTYEKDKTVIMEEQVARAFVPNFLQEVVTKSAAPQTPEMPKDEETVDKADVSKEKVNSNGINQQKTFTKDRKVKKG